MGVAGGGGDGSSLKEPAWVVPGSVEDSTAKNEISQHPTGRNKPSSRPEDSTAKMRSLSTLLVGINHPVDQRRVK